VVAAVAESLVPQGPSVGSRLATTSRPCPRNQSASRRVWVDLPVPSMPSRTMKMPWFIRS
jgi:hypothetical protein